MSADIQKMITLAIKQLKNAYNPYSNYSVGCCIYADNGRYYSGCNIENASYSLVLCAESSAIAAMISDGAKIVRDVVIVNHLNTECSPCGACRQRIYEFATPDTKIHLCHEQGVLSSFTLDELLPHQFNAKTMRK